MPLQIIVEEDIVRKLASEGAIGEEHNLPASARIRATAHSFGQHQPVWTALGQAVEAVRKKVAKRESCRDPFVPPFGRNLSVAGSARAVGYAVAAHDRVA